MQLKCHIANIGLPLLAKELLEQAARKRTYIVRVVYAALLFFAAFLFFYDALKVATASPMAVLGRGKELFAILVGLQFAGIYFFMPAMTCAVLTHEKERASLQLLFLTRLGPWTILFEKLTSRLIPMLGFLLLSLPLLAFAYTLGGISPEFLASSVWLLALAVIQMGTLALACSAWFRSTVGAFIWSYILELAMLFGPALGCLFIYSLTGLNIHDEHVIFPMFGPAFFEPYGAGRITSAPLIAHSVLLLGTSAICLGLARVFVVGRAFAPPGNAVLSIFKRLDKIFLRLNDNPITRGRTIVGDRAALPESEPVGWRETTKRSLGKTQYLLRVFIAVELPVAAICLMAIFASLDATPMSILLVPVGIVSVLMIAVQSASLIAGERTHQTLDVLCATPLLGHEIIRQKFRSVRRLMLVLLVPFLTIFFFESSMKWEMPRESWRVQMGYREFDLKLYLACSLLTVGVYLPMFAWLSLYVGLRVKTQAKAIMGSLAAILAWCVAPLVFILMPLTILVDPRPDSGFGFVALLSPASIMAFNEDGYWRNVADSPWLAVAVNFAGYGVITLWLRQLCYSRADRLLGRLASEGPTGPRPESSQIDESPEIDACLAES